VLLKKLGFSPPWFEEPGRFSPICSRWC